jgi:hypothetical protein
MYKNIKVEAENNELILENSHGDKVIIPANKRDWVKQKLKDNCHGCIDNLVETLPVASQYAQDGSVYAPGSKVKVNQNNQVKEYDISSKEYIDLYDSGKLASYDKDTETYMTTPLEEIVVADETPEWLKYKNEYGKMKSKDEFISKHLTPLARRLGNTETNYPARLDEEYEQKSEEYEQKSLDYVSKQLIKNKPQGKLDRVEWLNNLSDKEEELIKRNPRYQSTLWEDTKRGLSSLVEQNPGQAFSDILNSTDFTRREKQEMLKDYADNPILAKLGDAAKLLSFPAVGSKLIQSTYTEDYSTEDALKGIKNDAGIIEDIVTDPLNLLGIGLWGKLSKLGKFKSLDEVYQSIKGLSKEEALSDLTSSVDDVVKRFYHAGLEPNATLDDINITRLAQRQQKKGREYAGFYMSPDLNEGSWALKYSKENPTKGLHEITLPKDAKGFVREDGMERITKQEIKKLQKQGYDYIEGKNIFGESEYVLLNKNKASLKSIDLTSSVDGVGKSLKKTASQHWEMQELPGLHLKSTMEGEAISKIVEPKTGLINTEQALAIIGKESSGADKVALVRQGLGDNIPAKMDYNEFRKVVQDKLIPLERQFNTQGSNYGIDRIGYSRARDVEANLDGTFNIFGNPTKFKTREEAEEFLKLHLPLENQTLILGNKSKFGRGSNAHGNPEETLGHIHFLRDAENPDVLTVTQIQSDAFQGTHRIMPDKTKKVPEFFKQRQEQQIQNLKKSLEEERVILNKYKTNKVDDSGYPIHNSQIKQIEESVIKKEQDILFKEAELKNLSQKQLLDKNHQERYLQELVDYAGKRGDINKVRVPTSETVIKVQNYRPVTNSDQVIELYNKVLNTPEYDIMMADLSEIEKVKLQKILKGEIKGDIYDSEHETILKKYSEQPKVIKKIFGKEPTIVTDSKGNTWYEFDIPDKFKRGKGEIKAFALIPPAIGAASYMGSETDTEIPKNDQ